MSDVVSIDGIEQRIFVVRAQRVMLSTHLAALYDVEPRALVQAVKRNRERFPPDFMFQLSAEEFGSLKSQIVISKQGGLRRATPYAFTEQGVAMLSSVLRSKRAVRVNIEIMRAFVKLREMMARHKDLASKLGALEQKYDAQFKVVFDAIRQLMSPPPPSRPKPIGFSDGEVTEKIPDLRCQCRGGYSGAMSLLIAGDDLGQATVGTGRSFGT